VWSALDLLLEGFVFALIGLQLKGNLERLAETELGVWANVGIASIILVAVILVRPLFVFPTYYVSLLEGGPDLGKRQAMQEQRAARWLDRERKRGREPSAQTLARVNGGRAVQADKRMNWRELAVVSWTGMRGVVTLAAAASIPESLPERDTLVFIAFFVTVGTLLLQGLTLPLVITSLKVTDPGQEQRDLDEERRVTVLALEEGVAFADAHRDDWAAKYGERVADAVLERMRAQIARQSQESLEESAEDSVLARPDFVQMLELRKDIIRFRREVLIRERDAGSIDEEVMREVLLGIDAEEFALDTSAQSRMRG